ncbi:PTS sugar transporter subunit IIA, partial [candidate division WOR-3 bacterium]|nr:PTS sugar transporter subunit IIA [candidate division WOR-3 bacterium]
MIEEKNVFILKSSTSKGVYSELLKGVKTEHYTTILKALLDREKINSFVLEGNIAFPHARINLISSPIVSIGISPSKDIPFPWQMENSISPVNFVFLLVLPTQEYYLNSRGKYVKYSD